MSAPGTGITSTGENWQPDSYNFEFGAFTTGFTPTSENVADWEANWTALATTTWLDDSGDLYYMGTGTISSLTEPFIAGASLYVWGFDSKNNETNEWILLTSENWTVAANITNPLSSDYVSIDLGVRAILGTIDSSGANFQSASVGSAVPEPATVAAFFGGLALAGVLIVRRRRQTKAA